MSTVDVIYYEFNLIFIRGLNCEVEQGNAFS